MNTTSTIAAGTALPGAPPPQTPQQLPRQSLDEVSQLRVIPARYLGRRIGTLIALAIIIATLHSMLLNERWGWGIFAEWFFDKAVLVGLSRTLLLTLLGTIFGFTLGTFLALARVSGSPLLAGVSWTFIWIFRSIPLIVLLLLINNLGYLYEFITIGVPYTGIHFFSWNTTQLITPFLAAVIGLTLNQAAFSAEIVRGGILSVDQGQLEAASALGLSHRRQSFRIVLPQAMRSILPTAFNEIIGLAKGTSQVYILALPELFYTVQIIYRRNLEVIPLLMVATVWYLVILTVLSIGQYFIERYFSKGALRNRPAGIFDPILARLRSSWAKRSAASATPPASEPVLAAAAVATAAPMPFLRAQGAHVRVHGVSKSFGANKVLNNISIDFPASSVTVILGASGSGKSTLLRSINHLERVDQGLIAIDDHLLGYRLDGDSLYELKEKDILEQRVEVGMVFQSFNLFPHLTVLQNIVEAPISVRGTVRATAEAQARDLLARVGLADRANAYPRQLSGGQQQRVAIARALALRPKVLLFDEPTSALDPELVNEVLSVIKELARSGTTLIVVTHEIGFAREVADSIVFMENGVILEQGPPEQLLNKPSHPRTADFLQKVL